MIKNTNSYILITIFLLVSFCSLSVNRNKDTLLKVINSNASDSVKIEAYYILGYDTPNEKTAEAFQYFNKSEALALKSCPALLGEVYRHIGAYYGKALKDYSKAYEYTSKSIDWAIKYKNDISLYYSYRHLGRYIFLEIGMNNECVAAMKQALEIAKKHPVECNLPFATFELGWIAFNCGMVDLALVHLIEANRLNVLTNAHIHERIESLGWVGNGYNGLRKFDLAILYRKKALHLADSIGDKFIIGESKRYLGNFYSNKKQFDSAMYFLQESWQDFNPENKQRHPYLLNDMVRINSFIGNKYNLDKYVLQLLDTSKYNFNKAEDTRMTGSSALYKYYTLKKEYKLANNYLITYTQLKDSMQARTNRNNVNEQNLKYNFQKEQEEKKLNQQRKEFEVLDKLKRQKTFTYLSLAAVVIVVILLILSFNNIKQRKKAFKIISNQKEEVEKQKFLVDTKNKEIHDSINYAKRLQEAILPNTFEIRKCFKELFLLYKPKDIVAGDFYFFEKLDDIIIIAAADCTGHGVPGALVSVVCSNALTRSIKEFKIKDAGKILDKTRELVLETFSKSSMDVKDGMDISLLVIEKANNDSFNVQWAGANNGLWYFNKGTFNELNPDKQPIGLSDNPKPFNVQNITAEAGDLFYLFTDGYADQFGGDGGKKLKYKLFEKLITDNHHLPLTDQLNTLDTFFESWKGDLEQLDDVCIIGIKL